MYSCSNRDIPLQTAASISPCVFINGLRVLRAIDYDFEKFQPRSRIASMMLV